MELSKKRYSTERATRMDAEVERPLRPFIFVYLVRAALVVGFVYAISFIYVTVLAGALSSAIAGYHDDPTCGGEDLSGHSDGESCDCPQRSNLHVDDTRPGGCKSGTVKSGECVCPDDDVSLPLNSWLVIVFSSLCAVLCAVFLYRSFKHPSS